MTNMNNLQEAIDHLVIHDTSVFMYGGKQTLFATYGISKISIGEPVIVIDHSFIQSIKQELQELGITKNTTKNIDNV